VWGGVKADGKRDGGKIDVVLFSTGTGKRDQAQGAAQKRRGGPPESAK